jgi:hypothetical protein
MLPEQAFAARRADISEGLLLKERERANELQAEVMWLSCTLTYYQYAFGMVTVDQMRFLSKMRNELQEWVSHSEMYQLDL